MGLTPQKGEAEKLPELVTTAQAKKILAKKGYMVKSHGSFKSVVSGLTVEKKGKDHWYHTSELMQIPDKI